MVAGRVYVIAEAGVNHNGDLPTALELVDVAAASGADAVKFQSFLADNVAGADAPKAEYQKATTGAGESQLEMLRRLELRPEAHQALVDRAKSRGITFLSTPFDESSADLLEGLGVPLFKIPSGEITNLFLLRHIAAKRRPVILSTGMSTIDEVEAAMRVLREGGVPELTLLHCVSDYPAPPEDMNLRAMATMRERFGVPVGLSDHTRGITIPIAAAALGAAAVEKHFTLDRSMAGPDHRASIEPHELRAMIQGIREVEVALGDGSKRPTLAEETTKRIVRRSLTAAEDLAPGTILERRHLGARRPATGISPMDADRVLGRRLRERLPQGAVLRWDHLA